MITWYRSNEKLPAIGEEIVGFGMDKRIIIYEENYVRTLIYDYDTRIENFTHWAYAKDFNFPEEK